ncbi:Hpt domain-containing protein, partial [Myxococcota bacterium]|nr:Hpt domain-containing protein [Myxococcota bacterium]MBU1535585.1 Hpt domain-containing protein [Myxococcota bacterium]
MAVLGMDLGPSANWFLQRLMGNRPSELQFRLAKKGLLMVLDALAEYDAYGELSTLSSEQVPDSLFLESLALQFEAQGYASTPQFLVQGESVSAEDRENSVMDFYDPDLLATLLQVFCEEAQEHLEFLTNLIQQSPLDDKSVYEIYRGAHTLKGASATVGLDHISAASKLLEDYYHNHHDSKTLPSTDEHILTIMALIMLEDTIVHGVDGTAVISRLLGYAGVNPESGDRDLHSTMELSPVSMDLENSSSGDELFIEYASGEAFNTALPQAPSDPRDPWEPDRPTLEQVPLDEMQLLLQEVFSQEAEDHISAYDRGIEGLTRGEDSIYDLFRTTHTLKGAAATVGQTIIAKSAHMLEDYFDHYHQKNQLPPAEALPVLFHTASLLRSAVTSGTDIRQELRDLLDRALLSKGDAKSGEPENSGTVRDEDYLSKEHQHRKTLSGTGSFSSLSSQNEDDQVASRFLKIPTSSIDHLIGNSEELTLVRTQIEKSRDEFIS